MTKSIYPSLVQSKKSGRKSFAVLIDPDKAHTADIDELLQLVIDGGAPTTVSYISNASPIPADKNEIAVCTAMAGEMLGLQLIYMDAGSGAKRPVSEEMIERVAGVTNIPLLIGGGIKDPEKAYRNCKAGADMIIIGNAIEKDPSLICEMSAAIHALSIPL